MFIFFSFGEIMVRPSELAGFAALWVPVVASLAAGWLGSLIAETDAITAKLEKEFLSMAGYDVLIVDDGRAILQEARQGEHELIILDIILPGLNGLEVCRTLKKTRGRRR